MAKRQVVTISRKGLGPAQAPANSQVKRPLDVLLIAGYATITVVALLLTKGAMLQLKFVAMSGFPPLFPTLQLIAGALLYIMSFLVWLLVLSRLPLSTAFPVATGLTLSFSTLGAFVVLGEMLTPLKILGLILIFAGIVCVTFRANA